MSKQEPQPKASTLPQRLNLGAGDDYREGWHNVDHRETVDPDELSDLNNQPWPWPDNCFDHVLARHVVEHLDDQRGALAELARITKPGGTIVIRAPHHNSASQVIDPTHTTPVDPRTLRHELAPDWQVENIEYDRIRIGRFMPEATAVWLADMIGHIIGEWEATLRIPEGDT